MPEYVTSAHPRLPIPRTPLLGWDWITWRASRQPFRLFGLENGQFASSGRAALYWALDLTGIGTGSSVLVPTYHCPTIIAPVVRRGATPVFYPLTGEGLPDLRRLDKDAARTSRAMIVPQLFGLPRDLSEVRRWCDSRGICLIEDCAHTLFGKAGARHVGHWGDYATASLAKFLPVTELGWIACASRPLPPIPLASPTWLQQAKAVVDPLELAALYGRLGKIARASLHLNVTRRQTETTPTATSMTGFEQSDLQRAMASCDMERVDTAPALASCWFAAHAELSAIATRRRHNFDRMVDVFQTCGVGRPLAARAPADTGPYVMPLLVDNADRLYAAMRRERFPVYRWDRVWPGTPALENDISATWRRGLLQIPVHQSYTNDDFTRIAQLLARLRQECAQ